MGPGSSVPRLHVSIDPEGGVWGHLADEERTEHSPGELDRVGLARDCSDVRESIPFDGDYY